MTTAGSDDSPKAQVGAVERQISGSSLTNHETANLLLWHLVQRVVQRVIPQRVASVVLQIQRTKLDDVAWLLAFQRQAHGELVGGDLGF